MCKKFNLRQLQECIYMTSCTYYFKNKENQYIKKIIMTIDQPILHIEFYSSWVGLTTDLSNRPV